MKTYNTEWIRNVGIVGHGDTGKTQLVSSLLFTAGMTPRLGKVTEGSTTTDWDEEEIARKISINTGIAYAEWQAPAQPEKTKINLLDTPGYSTFINETKSSLIAADAALILVDAAAGVQVVTEKVWDYAAEYDLPRAFLLNWMDRDLASFERSLESVQQVFGRGVVPIQLPIGWEKGFRGVVDLITMKALIYTPDGNGIAKIEEIPQATGRRSEAGARDAGGNGGGRQRRIDAGIFRSGHAAGPRPGDRLARSGAGEAAFPGDAQFGAAQYRERRGAEPDGRDFSFARGARGDCCATRRRITRARRWSARLAHSEPLAVFVFKTLADPFAGRINYFKVISGVLKNDATLTNFNRGSQERFQHIQVMQGKTFTEVSELRAGDIGCIAKLKETTTGETLGDKNAAIFHPPARIPEPSITFAVEPKTRADEDRIGVAIHKILEEDLALRFGRDPQTKEFLLSGAGQQHIEVVVAKLRKRYHVELMIHPPKVPYRETIRGKADAEGKHKKQTGGHGQFGLCRIKMEPLPRGKGIEFVDDVFGGAIPKNWIPSVEKGIRDSAERGYLAGFPVVDFRVSLYDGKYHDVDSSDMAFKIAGSLAFKEAMKQARPALLEPIMNVEVYAPDQYSGDLMGHLSGRRGKISGSEARAGNVVIKALVPFSEMLSYANELISLTQGRGSYSMEFSHYDYVPNEIAEKVIAAHKPHHVGDEETEAASA